MTSLLEQGAESRGQAPGLAGTRARPGTAVRSTLTSMRFDPRLPFEAWTQFGARIAGYASGTAWWLGDWLTFGRQKYGRRYKQAVASTGLDYQTLRNYAVVARRFDVSRRRADLTFQHHAEVCALADHEQDQWLAMASAHGWSRNELRRHLRSSRVPSVEQPPVGDVRVPCGPERARRWREAAQRSGAELEDWVVRTLDDAALTALGGP